jgi:hypothetical protein
VDVLFSWSMRSRKKLPNDLDRILVEFSPFIRQKQGDSAPFEDDHLSEADHLHEMKDIFLNEPLGSLTLFKIVENSRKLSPFQA